MSSVVYPLRSHQVPNPQSHRQSRLNSATLKQNSGGGSNSSSSTTDNKEAMSVRRMERMRRTE